MNKEKVIKLISLFVNLFIIIVTTYVIIRAIFFGYHFGDIVVPPYEFSYFQYFTNLSNIYAAIVAIVLLIYTIIHFKDNDPLPRWLSLVALGASTGVALTFLTVVFFLAPTYAINNGSYFIMFSDDMIFTHFLTPVASSLAFIFLFKHTRISIKDALFGIIPMALYAIVYSPLVLSGVWNDFYGFTFGGNWWAIFLALPIMLCVTYFISFALSIVTRRRQK